MPAYNMKEEMAQSVLIKAFLQPAKTTAMCTEYACPPSLITPFCQRKTYNYSKWIVPTDNMRPKLHDEYIHRLKETSENYQCKNF